MQPFDLIMHNEENDSIGDWTKPTELYCYMDGCAHLPHQCVVKQQSAECKAQSHKPFSSSFNKHLI